MVAFSPVRLIAVPVELTTSIFSIMMLFPLPVMAPSLALVKFMSLMVTSLFAMNMLDCPLASIVWLLPLMVIPSGMIIGSSLLRNW